MKADRDWLWRLFKFLICVVASCFIIGVAAALSGFTLIVAILGWTGAVALAAVICMLIWIGMEPSDD